jgi:hypothetical protein
MPETAAISDPELQHAFACLEQTTVMLVNDLLLQWRAITGTETDRRNIARRPRRKRDMSPNQWRC